MTSVTLVMPTALLAFLHKGTNTPLESALAVCAPATDPNLTQLEFVAVLERRALQLQKDGWSVFDPAKTQHVAAYHNFVARNDLLKQVDREGEEYGQLYDMSPQAYWALANTQKLPDGLISNLDPVDEFTSGLWLVSEDVTAVIKLEGPSDRNCVFFAASDQLNESDLTEMSRQPYVGISDGVYDYRYNQNVHDNGGIWSAFKMDSTAFESLLETEISSAWKLEIESQNWNLR